ncbi:unnamed protein product [Boreogadus saida]
MHFKNSQSLNAPLRNNSAANVTPQGEAARRKKTAGGGKLLYGITCDTEQGKGTSCYRHAGWSQDPCDTEQGKGSHTLTDTKIESATGRRFSGSVTRIERQRVTVHLKVKTPRA